MLFNLTYGSCLAYSPHGESTEEERKSRQICHGIKQDRYSQGYRLISHAITRLKEDLTPDLEDLLASDVLLVPAPKSAPFSPKQRDILWVPRLICEELLDAGFGLRMEPLLLRHTAVAKSAYASRGQRPSPEEHYASMAVDRRISDRPQRITLVDDVITKGSTLLAGASHLAEAFPGATIRSFALIRTMGWSFSKIIDPAYGQITLTKWGPKRVP